jgi:hypothetical protein
MTKESTCWGCPEWRQEDAYPAELETWQWRWEFLRRNPDYRESWERAETNPDTLEFCHDEDNRDSNYLKLAFPCEPDAEIVERVWQMGKMILNPTISWEYLVGTESIFADSTVLFSLPTFSYIENYLRKNDFPPARQVRILLSFVRDTLKISSMERAGEIALAKFDLTRPINPQMEKAKQELEECLGTKTRKPRVDKGNMLLYLRLIDAEDQCARPMQIFKKLEAEGNEQICGAANEASRISDMTEAARKLQTKISFSP